MTALLLAYANPAVAEPDVWVIDSMEFNIIDHDRVKREYVRKVARTLRSMTIRRPGFDSRELTADRLELLLGSREDWRIIAQYIDQECSNTPARPACQQLAEARADLYDRAKEERPE